MIILRSIIKCSELVNYTKITTEAALVAQIAADHARITAISALPQPLTTELKSEQAARQLAVDYAEHGRYNGYTYNTATPQELRNKTMESINSTVPHIQSLFQDKDTSNGYYSGGDSDIENEDESDGDDDRRAQNRNKNKDLPGYLYETRKLHKKLPAGRGIASQSGSCIRYLDRMLDMGTQVVYKLLRRRSLRIYEQTGINPWWIVTNSKQVTTELPAQTPNLECADVVGAYDKIQHGGRTGLKQGLASSIRKAITEWRHEHNVNPHSPLALYFKRTTNADNNPFEHARTIAFIHKGPANLGTIECVHDGTDDNGTVIRMHLSYFQDLINLFVDSNFVHIGDLCFGRYQGFGQGCITSPRWFDLYLGDKEDTYLAQFYERVLTALAEENRIQGLLIAAEAERGNGNRTMRIRTLTQTKQANAVELREAKREGSRFNHVYRFQDDVLALMDSVTNSFASVTDKIYQGSVELISTAESLQNYQGVRPVPHTANYLDLKITRRQQDGTLHWKQYDKREQYAFKVVTIDRAASNTPLRQQEAIFGSQSVRLYNCTKTYKVFIKDLLILYGRYKALGYDGDRLLNCMRVVFSRFGENKYGSGDKNSVADWIKGVRRAFTLGRS